MKSSRSLFGKTHLALHPVLDDGLALVRRLEADGGLRAGRRLGRVAVAPAAVIAQRCGPRRAPSRASPQLVRRGVAVIGLARAAALGDLAMARGAGELEDRLAVPVEPEPAQPVEDGVDRRLGRALAVGVLDPQQHRAAGAARIQPVEQRRAGAADMQEAGGRGGKAGDDGIEPLSGADR